MLKLHFRACPGRDFLYDLGEVLPSVEVQLLPPAKQDAAAPVLWVGYEVCPVHIVQMGGCFRVSLLERVVAHTGQCAHVAFA